MKDITVKKLDLIKRLEKNLAEHKKIFDEAVEGYRKKGVTLLEDHIKRIRSGSLEQVYVSLPVPEDHSRDYERVIEMLKMSIHEEIEIPEGEFRAYVMDDWAWKRQFIEGSAQYSKLAARAATKL